MAPYIQFEEKPSPHPLKDYVINTTSQMSFKAWCDAPKTGRCKVHKKFPKQLKK